MNQTIKKEAPAKETSINKIAQNNPKVNRVKTITLNGKTEYAKVSARIAEFHKIHKNGSIKNTRELKDGFGIFEATVTLDVKNSERTFNGTSFGKLGGIKALEKLETIAVGRALAFAGFLSDGEIASVEEMAIYEESTIQIDTSTAIEKLKAVKDLEELKLVWTGLTQAERNNPEIAFAKEELKLKFEEVQREDV